MNKWAVEQRRLAEQGQEQQEQAQPASPPGDNPIVPPEPTQPAKRPRSAIRARGHDKIRIPFGYEVLKKEKITETDYLRVRAAKGLLWHIAEKHAADLPPPRRDNQGPSQIKALHKILLRITEPRKL